MSIGPWLPLAVIVVPLVLFGWFESRHPSQARKVLRIVALVAGVALAFYLVGVWITS
jgi:hypothetical protein